MDFRSVHSEGSTGGGSEAGCVAGGSGVAVSPGVEGRSNISTGAEGDRVSSITLAWLALRALCGFNAQRAFTGNS